LDSLDCEFIFTNRHAVHKLNGAPQAMELCALIHVHHAVGWGIAMPDGIIQIRLDPCEHNLKHGESAAEPLSGQQVAFSCYVCLLSTQTSVIKQSENLDGYANLRCSKS
jgi:hypothetical protein